MRGTLGDSRRIPYGLPSSEPADMLQSVTPTAATGDTFAAETRRNNRQYPVKLGQSRANFALSIPLYFGTGLAH